MLEPSKYYLPEHDVTDFNDEQLLASLQHYHYERSFKFNRKAKNAQGKPYYPMLRNIGVWHHNMANFVTRMMNKA
jgi:hypothetical protein